ncbi:Putative multidrug efflux MFS transporter [Candidatus Megaera polyxenophila]|nr:Putative multidrug efflux MFS transporter [Candidatus Megaera polyxenophila]
MSKNLPFLFVISLLTCCIEIDISVPSFPDISDYFNISDGLTQMTIAVNFFGFCLSSVAYGPLSDCYGRRNVMLIGNAIMLIGGVLCVVAHSIELLLIARFIQGFGASTSAVVVFAMIADVYESEKAAKLIGIMNSLITVFMSIAPIAGGFINNLVGFRGNYFIIALVSLISWIMLYFQLPETKKEKKHLEVKAIAKNFYTLATDKRFLYTSLTPSLTYSGYMSFIACAPFLYIETYDLPIMYYAINQGIIIAIFSIFSMYSGRITSYLGEKICVVYGTSFLFLAGVSGPFIGFLFPKSPFLTTSFMIIYSIGAAITYPIIFTKSLDIFPEIRGTASSTIMATRSLLCALFIAFTSYIYNGTLLNISLGLLLSSLLTVFFTFRLLKLIGFATKKN